MRRYLLAAAAAFALCAMPALARAEIAYTTTGVNMRAGPDSYYPRVSYIPGGEEVDVIGCVDDWTWCDVVAYGERGWIAAHFLEYPYEGGVVLIPDYGPRLGLSIVGFTFGYWDNHYRNYSWYGRRGYWSDYSHSHPRVYASYARYGGSYYWRDGYRYDVRTNTRSMNFAPVTRSTTYRSGAYRSGTTYRDGTVTSGSWRERARTQQEMQGGGQSSVYQRQLERNARASRSDYSTVERQRAEQNRSARIEREQRTEQSRSARVERQRAEQNRSARVEREQRAEQNRSARVERQREEQNRAARVERQQTARAERSNSRERAERQQRQERSQQREIAQQRQASRSQERQVAQQRQAERSQQREMSQQRQVERSQQREVAQQRHSQRSQQREVTQQRQAQSQQREQVREQVAQQRQAERGQRAERNESAQEQKQYARKKKDDDKDR